MIKYVYIYIFPISVCYYLWPKITIRTYIYSTGFYVEKYFSKKGLKIDFDGIENKTLYATFSFYSYDGEISPEQFK